MKRIVGPTPTGVALQRGFQAIYDGGMVEAIVSAVVEAALHASWWIVSEMPAWLWILVGLGLVLLAAVLWPARLPAGMATVLGGVSLAYGLYAWGRPAESL